MENRVASLEHQVKVINSALLDIRVSKIEKKLTIVIVYGGIAFSVVLFCAMQLYIEKFGDWLLIIFLLMAATAGVWIGLRLKIKGN